MLMEYLEVFVVMKEMVLMHRQAVQVSLEITLIKVLQLAWKGDGSFRSSSGGQLTCILPIDSIKTKNGLELTVCASSQMGNAGESHLPLINNRTLKCYK